MNKGPRVQSLMSALFTNCLGQKTLTYFLQSATSEYACNCCSLGSFSNREQPLIQSFSETVELALLVFPPASGAGIGFLVHAFAIVGNCLLATIPVLNHSKASAAVDGTSVRPHHPTSFTAIDREVFRRAPSSRYHPKLNSLSQNGEDREELAHLGFAMDVRPPADLLEEQDVIDMHPDEVGEDVEIRDRGRNKDMNLTELVLLTICLTGVQFTWSVELAYGTPYLLSLGLPKALTALVWLAGPLSGLLIQPIVGVYSDKCTFKMGRRRPFMIGGGALVVISIAMIAYSREIAEWFWSADNPDTAGHVKTFTILVAVTAFYFLDFSINAVQASCRSLIVDVAPLQQQETANAWGARMIGVGNVIGYFVGYLDLPTFFPFLGNTQLKVLCWLAALWFSSTLATTCWYVKEKRFAPEARHLGRQWYAPMVDIVHAMRNLPGPVQDICNVQFFAWLGVFPFLFYSTTWVSEKAAMSPAPAPADGDMDGTRAGSFALLLFAIVSLFTGFVLPLITVRKDESESDDSHAHGLSMLRPKTWTKLLQLPPVWATSTWFFAILMFATWWINTVSGATALIALVGVSWGVMMWVPMALLGEAVSYYSINPGAVTSTSDEAGYATVPSEENLFPPTSTGAGTTRPADRPQLDAGLVLGIHNVYVVLPQFLSTFLSSVVFAVIGWIAKSHGPPPASPVPPPSDSLPAFDEGIGPDPYDAVGWVLRVGALSSLIAGYMAWKVREVRGDGKMNNNEILVSAH